MHRFEDEKGEESFREEANQQRNSNQPHGFAGSSDHYGSGNNLDNL